MSSEFYKLPEGTQIPSYQAGIENDTALNYYPRLLNLVNGFTASDSGLVIVQIVVTSSNPLIQINGVPYTLSPNSLVGTGYLAEFDVHVRKGEIVNVDTTTCALRALFFRRGQ